MYSSCDVCYGFTVITSVCARVRGNNVIASRISCIILTKGDSTEFPSRRDGNETGETSFLTRERKRRLRCDEFHSIFYVCLHEFHSSVSASLNDTT